MNRGGATTNAVAADAEAIAEYEAGLLPNNSGVNPRYYLRPINECYCGGDFYNTGAHDDHVVYVAFLRYTNGEFEQRQASVVDTLLPVNWLACVLGRTDIIHTQIVFSDRNNGVFYTVSTDSSRGVHVMSRKAFANTGWLWHAVPLRHDQEVRLHNFLMAQCGKRFSRWGILLLYVWPVNLRGSQWFCSELVVTALRHVGLLRQWHRAAHTIAPHELYNYLCSTPADIKCHLLLNNPVQVTLYIDGIRRSRQERQIQQQQQQSLVPRPHQRREKRTHRGARAAQQQQQQSQQTRSSSPTSRTDAANKRAAIFAV